MSCLFGAKWQLTPPQPNPAIHRSLHESGSAALASGSGQRDFVNVGNYYPPRSVPPCLQWSIVKTWFSEQEMERVDNLGFQTRIDVLMYVNVALLSFQNSTFVFPLRRNSIGPFPPLPLNFEPKKSPSHPSNRVISNGTSFRGMGSTRIAVPKPFQH